MKRAPKELLDALHAIQTSHFTSAAGMQLAHILEEWQPESEDGVWSAVEILRKDVAAWKKRATEATQESALRASDREHLRDQLVQQEARWQVVKTSWEIEIAEWKKCATEAEAALAKAYERVYAMTRNLASVTSTLDQVLNHKLGLK